MGAIGLNPIRLDRIGLDPIRINAIKLGVPRAASDRPYIDPEVLASLKAVCICYGKSNDDPDRAIVKNLVDPDNPFVISNAAFKLNSGFGKYEVDFTVYNNQNVLVSPNKIVSIAGREFISLLPYTELSKTISSYKIKVTGLIGELSYWYRNQDGSESRIIITKDGIYQLSTCYNVENGQGSSVGFNGYSESSCTIEQIPSFEGAFVTDGIDDTIISTKTLAEMGITDEVTVVSMIHQISLNPTYNNGFTNYIENLDKSTYVRNNIYKAGKTGIYGYSASLTSRTYSDINNILGDKKDYGTEIVNRQNTLDRTKFSVVGRASNISEVSSIAWYWNFISNKYLTTDQINQVIAYFNLDRTLKPDILCDVKKQGITNENHAEFGDRLIDFSGNGRDIQLNNIAWKGDSGIGKYNFSNINIIASNRFEGTITTNKCHFTKKLTNTTNNFCDLLVIFPNEPIKFKVSGLSDGRKLFVANKSGSGSNYNFDNGEHEVSLSFAEGVGQNNPFGVTGDIGDIDVTVEFIPSHAGALCLDGVNDFGKVTGMPIYKDYTFIAEREFLSTPDDFVNAGSIVSKMHEIGKGSFIFETFTKTQAREVSFSSTTDFDNPNTERIISYQSKYSYNGKALTAGQVEDRDVMWLGTIRDNDTRFVNAAIYSLMLFPYSMSEFLIERQLKKHKLGTLYPDMVEFRPIVPKDDRIESINYYNENDRAYIGNYYPIGSNTSISFKMVKPYKITSIKVNGANTVYNHNNGFNFKMPSKSPQKFTNLNIVEDTSIVQWNPVITSTARLTTAPTFVIRGTTTLLKPGDWIPKNSEIWVIVTMNDLVDKLIKFSLNGTFIHIPSSSYNPDTGKYGFPFVIDNESTQNINLTIDEYIRFEDIVQPYPSLFTLIDYDTEEVYSWGSKLKVGTKFKGNVINLLPDMYEWQGNILYNGEVLDWRVNPGVVAKEMVFSWNMPFKYLIDNNEPKCILSPRILRMPNSSYKYLGYIPDISGHGNHGVIHNSAYSGYSGADGIKICNFYISNYLIDGKAIADKLNNTMSFLNDDSVSIIANPGEATVGGGKARVTGMKSNSRITFYASYPYLVITKDGIYDIPYADADATSIDLMSWSNCKGVTIESLGKYEGAYCLDGVDDFVTIPTTVGGKQVLMKVNWQKNDSMIYNQNPGEDNFAIFANDYNGSNVVKAYASRNNGSTYIDSILNNNILATQLKNVIHNITIANENVVDNTIVPVIGANAAHNNFYAQMALYDFMLFDNISTEDKIKELNEYVGIEAKVELPPYYLDAYGKTNLDADKATIQQRGVAVGDYDITNYNHAYDKMSGYGGYAFAKFDSTAEWIYTNNSDTIEVVNRDGYSVVLRKVGNGANYWHFRNTVIKSLGQDIRIGIYANNSIQIVWQLKYKLEGDTDYNTLAIASPTIEGNINTYVTLPYKTEQEIADLNAIDTYYSIYFIPIDLDINEEVTIEMLPIYPNGLVYDGVTDYSENANIPALTDYTYILKREIIKGIANSAVMYKGNVTVNRGGAFICNYCEPSDTNLFTDLSFGGLLRSNNINKLIIYGTKTSVNGNSITPGEKTDTVGINVGKWVNYLPMVFYKLILYPKTIPLLQINYLKNLMERDEIIDLNNPIFVQE